MTHVQAIKFSVPAVLAGFFCSLLLVSGVQPVKADPLERGIQGAIGGAILGGIVGGKKGVGRGAAIGGTIGILGGAAEAEERRRLEEEEYYEEREYRRRKRASYRKPSQLVYEIQESLVTLGYDPGPVDGFYGSRTEQAIELYEEENGLLVTGRVSDELLDHLKRHGG